jgi:DNA-directed RNA polymerase specialized sigma24 family protein
MEDTIRQFERMIKVEAMHWEPSFRALPVDASDLTQEGIIELFLKYKLYDRNKASWSTFIMLLTRNRILNILKYYNTQQAKVEMLSLDKPIEDSEEVLGDRLEITEYVPNTYQLYMAKEFRKLLYENLRNVRYTPEGFQNGNGMNFAQHLFMELTEPSPKLIKIARKRYKRDMRQKHIFKITQDDLANLFRVSRVTVQRGVKRLRDHIREFAINNGYAKFL